MCPDRIRTVVRPSTSSDMRTEFEKDYQRIILSASFRRLQDKTQVFPLDKSDFIRTRLTHSLEVANFARSIGRMIGSRIMSEGRDPDFTADMREDVCSVLECAGLLHDITKNLPASEHIRLIGEMTPLERNNPKVWHQMSAPPFLKER